MIPAARAADLLLAVGNTTLSNSFAQHPLAYFLSTAMLVALLLFVVFDSSSTLHQSVAYALFAGPVPMTVLAVIIGVVLDGQLQVILVDNGVAVGPYAPDQVARAIALGAAGITWLVLIARWLTRRSIGRRGRVRRERSLLPETQARLDLGNPYDLRRRRAEAAQQRERKPRR